PIRLLEREADIPPIAEFIKTIALAQAYKASQQPITNMTIQMTHQLRQNIKPWRGRSPKLSPTPQTRLMAEARKIVGKASEKARMEYQEKLRHFHEQRQ